MSTLARIASLLCLGVVFAVSVAGQGGTPTTGQLNDPHAVVSEGRRERANAILRSFAQQTGIEISVIVVDTNRPVTWTPEDFPRREMSQQAEWMFWKFIQLRPMQHLIIFAVPDSPFKPSVRATPDLAQSLSSAEMMQITMGARTRSSGWFPTLETAVCILAEKKGVPLKDIDRLHTFRDSPWAIVSLLVGLLLITVPPTIAIGLYGFKGALTRLPYWFADAYAHLYLFFNSSKQSQRRREQSTPAAAGPRPTFRSTPMTKSADHYEPFSRHTQAQSDPGADAIKRAVVELRAAHIEPPAVPHNPVQYDGFFQEAIKRVQMRSAGRTAEERTALMRRMNAYHRECLETGKLYEESMQVQERIEEQRDGREYRREERDLEHRVKISNLKNQLDESEQKRRDLQKRSSQIPKSEEEKNRDTARERIIQTENFNVWEKLRRTRTLLALQRVFNEELEAIQDDPRRTPAEKREAERMLRRDFQEQKQKLEQEDDSIFE